MMQPPWQAFKERVSNRLSRHLRIAPLRLQNAGPVVSFTFDDVPKSAATIGAPLLEAYNARGTFYVAGGLVDGWSGYWNGASDAEIVALHRGGHEIGCHTFSHVRALDLSAAGLAAEIEKNRRYLLALDPSIRIENFSYPYGLASVAHKDQLGKLFHTSRGILPEVNCGTVDLQFLRAMPLIDRHIDPESIDRAFDKAMTDGGWLIFYSHDVADQPSPYGCSPALLRHALEAASRRKIPILSIAQALQRLGA